MPVSVATFFAPGVDATVESDDGTVSATYELGMRFQSTVPGWVVGVRYSRSPRTFIAPQGRLWSGTGTKLAELDFGGSTGSGWREAYFTQPVPIEANANYVVSYNAAQYYHVAAPYFASAITNGFLKTAATAGLYADRKPGQFPTSSFNNSNYWVDVLFLPNLAPHRIGGIYDAAAVHQLI